MLKFATPLLMAALLLRAEEPTNFIRVVEDQETAKLQTSVTTYTKDETNVTLIGAIHIGDRAYFETLNKEFTNYPALLFELIGGEDASKELNGKPKEATKGQPDDRPAKGLRELY